MPLFSSEAERQRRQNLKILEDKRLRFAQEMEARGFRPERMLFCSREDGSFAALARFEGRVALIDSPRFGSEGEFTLDLLDAPLWEREEVFEKGTGLNGAFGFGTKGASGFNLFVRNGDGMFVKFPFVYGRNSWMEANYRKNPLLKTKRRRADANVMWDFAPLDSKAVDQIEEMLGSYYLGDAGAAGRAEQAQPDEAERFYAGLRAAVEAEGLGEGERLHFGRLLREPLCLSVCRRSGNDCAALYCDEKGNTVFEKSGLTEAEAADLCLSFLRDQKQRRALFQKWVGGAD